MEPNATPQPTSTRKYKVIGFIVRWAITVLVLIGVWRETGTWTVIAFLLIAVQSELVVKTLTRMVDAVTSTASQCMALAENCASLTGVVRTLTQSVSALAKRK